MVSPSKRIVEIEGKNRRPWALATRDHLLQAATKEIASVGFERAKISSIAQRAKMAPGSVYTWFDNKEDLFQAALEDALKTQVLKNQVALADVDLKQDWIFQIAALVPRNHEDSTATDTQILLVESYYAAWRDKKARKVLLANINTHIDMYVRIVISGQENGQIPSDIDPKALAMILVAIPTGLSLLNLSGVPRIPQASWGPLVSRLSKIFNN